MIGQTISHYKILEKLGEGGMGVVYKAQDTKLDRLVALKFLPPHLSASKDDKARFIQEAKAAAALSHPNICAVHAIEEHDAQMFIVMDFVEGQTLREKVSSAALKQAIEIGVQIAEGLAAAHEKGVVHRDIKPENIMIRKDGIVQIMDFGLAKLRGASRITKEGSTVGTAGYMSPEQVQGQETDHRSDIFSLGTVLYELLTHTLPFNDVHEAAILYQIANVNPYPPSHHKPELGADLDEIVLECLQKDKEERFQSAKELGKALRRHLRKSGSSTATGVMPAQRPSFVDTVAQQKAVATSPFSRPRSILRKPLVWIGVNSAIFLTGMILGIGGLLAPAPIPPDAVRSFITPPPDWKFFTSTPRAGPLALSPDGRLVVFSATNEQGVKLLWVRAVDEPDAHALAATEGASYPFWSPDNKWIAFFADGMLKKISTDAGIATTICAAPTGYGGTWNKEGVILFAPSAYSPIVSVPSTGGVFNAVTTLDTTEKEQSHRWPYFHPDGEHFLYFARSTYAGIRPEGEKLMVASLKTRERKVLLQGMLNGAFADGFLLAYHNGSLFAYQFDLDKLSVSSPPTEIAGNVQMNPADVFGIFSASWGNVLSYQVTKPEIGYKLIVYDRTGKQLSTIGDLGQYWDLRYSPDNKLVAFSLMDQASQNMDIWTYNFAGTMKRRLTSNPAQDRRPLWSPDGKRILFLSNRKGTHDFYLKSLEEQREEELFFESPEMKHPEAWSPDGQYLLYSPFQDSRFRSDIWALPLVGEKKPFPVARTEGNEWDSRFSHDGKWIAYSSDESGQYEVYVRPFPGPDVKWKISTNGGARPRWRKDGKELYYMSLKDVVMVAHLAQHDNSLEVVSTRALFQSTPTTFAGNYDVTSDGTQFLINSTLESKGQSPFTLVYHWTSLVKKQ
ncbi:MAG: serine/threonine-protein kinase [Ignavibacteriales bacterium]|nr:serine/threonine-protein kinase [Ignavibacteriales bacterium]